MSDFHVQYYNSNVWKQTRWLGHVMLKCPLDLWIYQELIVRVRPSLIIETGTYAGGSAMFMASICDLLDRGQVLTIDIAPLAQPAHPRVQYLTGSSIDAEIVQQVYETARGHDTVLVILDSDHVKSHVIREMKAYAPLVSERSYLIVEDTNINGHPVVADYGPGPAEAVTQFLRHRSDFELDRSCERHLLTFNPAGFLRRIAPEPKSSPISD